MAARKTPILDQRVRDKIQTSMIVNRLTDHLKGKVELTNSQVRAGLGLLAKTLPDLSAVELSGETRHRIIGRSPPSDAEMIERHKVEMPSDTRH